jgi:hypothetical protein
MSSATNTRSWPARTNLVPKVWCAQDVAGELLIESGLAGQLDEVLLVGAGLEESCPSQPAEVVRNEDLRLSYLDV